MIGIFLEMSRACAIESAVAFLTAKIGFGHISPSARLPARSGNEITRSAPFQTPRAVPRSRAVEKVIVSSERAGSEAEVMAGVDEILRNAVRQNLDKWLQKLDCSGDVEKKLAFKMRFVEKLRESPVAVETAQANQQHYEVPTDFFMTVSLQINF